MCAIYFLGKAHKYGSMSNLKINHSVQVDGRLADHKRCKQTLVQIAADERTFHRGRVSLFNILNDDDHDDDDDDDSTGTNTIKLNMP